MNRKHIVSVGQVFDRLTVEQIKLRKPPRKGFYAQCMCTCGNVTLVDYGNLCRGYIKSCGCLRKEHMKNYAFNTTHGLGTNYIYMIWWNIKSRCTDTTNTHYSSYGGRGIVMYPEWLNSLTAFRKYIVDTLGERPDENKVLDRINNDGNYEPGNLRWATPSLSNVNKRKKSNYRWVYKHATGFRAECRQYDIRKATPTFKHEIEAAIAADYLATKLWGLDAKLLVNFPQHWETYKKIIACPSP